MKLSEIMTTPPQTIESGATITEAASIMRSRDIGMLPVLSGNRLVGVVTDRDMVIRGLTDGIAGKTVEQVMTSNPICLSQDAEIDDAIRTMQQNEIGRIVVTDAGGKPVGVVSAGAIAVAQAGNPKVGQLATDLSTAHRQSK